MSRAWVVVLLLAAAPAPAAVVVNEVMYHAPEHLDDVQFIELHNTGDKAVDLSGWKLAKAVQFTFPAKASLEPGGYVVVCKHAGRIRKYYGIEPAGQWEGSLDHGRGTIELLDAAGRTVDAVRYRSRAPWPVSPDGTGPSLERICPTAKEAGSENWAASRPPAGPPRPGGTPGKKNSVFADHLPPVISDVRFTPTHAGPDGKVTVEAGVRSAGELKSVELLYRVAGSGREGEEKAVAMTPSPKGKYTAVLPTQKAGEIARFRVRAADAQGGQRHFPQENDLRPALSVYFHDKFEVGKVPLGFIVNVGKDEFNAARRFNGWRGYGQPPGPTPAARGNSAFVFVEPKTGTPQLYDFVAVTPRNAGYKVRFHKDSAPRGLTTINLIYEYNDRFVLAEPLAYEVYRKAGNAAPRTEFVRTFVDGRPLGFQLLVEQPNKSFLRHAGLRTDGNLYKCQWFGNGVIAQHEKKTFSQPGHSDLIQMLNEVNGSRGEKQWEVIKKHFDVEQVINYFAVNMVLSHWDGYFNNYFTYHDIHGTGKWTMYPWDQDKTWGFHDGLRGYEVFHDMPITFGMAGDRPPNYPKYLPAPTVGIGYGTMWWRPGGHFSRPLLANPTFRQHFLARTKDLLEKVYTEEVFGPILRELGERVEDEVALRAQLQGQDTNRAKEHLRRNLDSLREHIKKRREFLLAQDEIKKAGKFDRTGLK
ncbi:MAG: CotH kinase family protein [Gemmataceae bacterium]